MAGSEVEVRVVGCWQSWQLAIGSVEIGKRLRPGVGLSALGWQRISQGWQWARRRPRLGSRCPVSQCVAFVGVGWIQ